jgi:D-glycero-alpha-D-manno-heptose 1-phosphate guanylyltransferase
MASDTSRGLDAIVLAGGVGSRLREVLPDRQKVTALVGGKPFLSMLIAWLARSGVSRVVLAAGHRSGDVRSVASEFTGPPQVRVSVEPVPLGTGGAARLALRMTEGDPILVLNGDSFADVDLGALRRFHAERNAAVSIALVSTNNAKRYGLVRTDENGKVLAFNEKPIDVDGGAINAGVYIFRRAALAALPENSPISFERDVFPELINRGLYAMLFTADFIDIGTPDSLQAAVGFFNRRGTFS